MSMTWQAWFTLVVVVVTVVLLVRETLAPSVVMLGGVIVLLVVGILTPNQAFAGFSNGAPITVAAMYVLARAVEKTGGLQPIVRWTLGEGRTERRALARLLIPSAAASAFLNNTPIVAMLVPQVTEWANRNGRSPSRYLMPLAFGVSLGGVVTVIGTSTNLVVSGLLEQSGQPAIGMFELSAMGLPIAAIGMTVLILLAPVLLPSRRPARHDVEAGVREFVVSMRVEAGGPLDGREVGTGGLRNLQGVFLVEVERGEEIIAPVAPTTVLKGNDRLTFVGRADLVLDLQAMRGLVSAERSHMEAFDTARHTFFEAVVGGASPLAGKTLKDTGFRGRYQAAVVAIHRAGRRVEGKLGQVVLDPGDTLMLLSDPGFLDRWRDTHDFLLVSRIGGSPPGVSRKAWFVGLVMLAVVVVAGAGLIPILQASLIGAIALIAVGVLTPHEARGSLDLDVLVLIAASFGMGAAMERTGLAAALASGVLGVTSPLGTIGAALGIVLATVILTELLSNNAAAALMFPIAMATASQASIPARPLVLAVAIAASLSFITPIGYQTNMMVYGPGGYRFSDYVRLGLPLSFITTVALVLMLR